MKRIKVFSIFMVIACLELNAQVTFKTEYFGRSAYRKEEGESSVKVGDSRGAATVYRGGINIPLSVKMDEDSRPTVWNIALGGAYVSLNNKNFTEDLVPDEIMNLGLNLSYLRPISRKWSMLLVVGGGIYAPSARFSQIRFKQVLGNVGAIFMGRLNPHLELGGGVAMNNSLGYPMVLPAFYLNWMLEGRFTVKTSMLEGLELLGGYNVNKHFSINLVAEMNGQMALVEKDGKEKIFSHQYMVAGLRPEWKMGKQFLLQVTAGIQAVRPAEYSDRSLKGMFSDSGYYFQVAPYASVGLNFNF